MEKKDVLVAVATHKIYPVPVKKGYYPIFVGKALDSQDIPDSYLRDDLGDNISEKNHQYCELTALYWTWKNTDSKILGQVHYRRYFSSWRRLFRRRPEDRLLDTKEIRTLLQNYEAILPKKRNYVLETMFSHYAHTHYDEHLKKLRNVLKETDPAYVPFFDQVMKKRSAHMYNMFIMKRELAEQYCTWLFPILEKLDDQIDYSEYSDYQGRYIGRMGELLLDVWFNRNKIRYKEMPIANLEKVNWVKKGKAFLAAKYLGKKYDRSF